MRIYNFFLRLITLFKNIIIPQNLFSKKIIMIWGLDILKENLIVLSNYYDFEISKLSFSVHVTRFT